MPVQSLKSKINRTLELVELWKQYRELFGKAIQGGTVGPEEESKFLELKSQIARRHQALIEVAGSKDLPDIRTLDVITRVNSLARLATLSELERDQIETGWNTTFVKLNQFLGTLEAVQERAREDKTWLKGIQKVLFNPWMTLIYLIVLIVLAYIVWFEWLGEGQAT